MEYFNNFMLRKSVHIRSFFLTYIFLHSDWIQENTDQKKTQYMDTFHAVSD